MLTLKAEWLNALRSGNYTQGQNHLRVGDKHCCLGVYCEILGIPRREYDTINENQPVILYEYQIPQYAEPDESWTDAMEPDLSAFGLDHDAASQLINMNDEGDTFATIADWIETTLP